MPRPIPTNNRNWLREIERTCRKAEDRVARGYIEYESLYTLAPEMAATRRGVSEQLREQAASHVKDAILDERSREDPGEYVFEFFMSYLDAHVIFGYLDEMEADEILKYIASEGKVFLDTYDDDV